MEASSVSWSSRSEQTNALRAAVVAALCRVCRHRPPSPTTRRSQKQVETLRASIAEQRAQLEAQAKLLEAQQAQLDALTKQLGQSKISTQEAPKVTFNNNRPTITAADGRSSIAFRANVQLDGAHVRRIAGRPAHHRLPPRLGGQRAQPREHRRARFQRRLLFPSRALRRRGHHRARLQLPPAAGARRLGHRGPDAHQRRVDRVHRLGAVHLPARRILAAGQHGRRHLARGPALPRTRQRVGVVALAGRRRRPPRLRRQGEWRTLDELAGVHHAHRRTTRKCSTRRPPRWRAPDTWWPPATTTTCTSAPRAPTCSRPPTRARAPRPAIRCAFASGPRSASTACGSSTPATSTPTTPASTASSSAATGRASIYRASTSGTTSRVARSANLPDPDFTGYYLQGSWILTGESRRYNAGHRARSRIRGPWCRSRAMAASARGSWRRATAA